MIKIEILALGDRFVRAAFYYPVDPADWLEGAEDQSRQPTGTRLSPDEVQALKDGELIESVVLLNKGQGVPMQTIKNLLETRYQAEQATALREYAQAYSGAGLAWDGTDWS